MGGWQYNCNGWKASNGEQMFWNDTQDGNQLPDSQKGTLDGELLSTMGLRLYRMNMVDALFFYQILLPICDPKKSGIAKDHQSRRSMLTILGLWVLTGTTSSL